MKAKTIYAMNDDEFIIENCNNAKTLLVSCLPLLVYGVSPCRYTMSIGGRQ
jgi:hypothetical protein